MSQNDKLIDFIQNLSQNFKDLESVCDDNMDALVINADGVKIKFAKAGELDAEGIVNKIKESTKKDDVDAAPKEPVPEPIKNGADDSDAIANEDKDKVGGGQYNFSDTSSVNGSFLNGRMNKYLRNSMTGGGKNSDTLASITELQANSMPRYNMQGGGGKMSKADFLKKMKESGITSSTSEFC